MGDKRFKQTDIHNCPCCASFNIRMELLDNGNVVGINCKDCIFYFVINTPEDY